MKKYIKQTSIITLCNVAAKVITMAFFAVLARMLTVDEYGYFRYLLNISLIFGIAFTGIATALTKFLGETNGEDKRKYFIADAMGSSAIVFLGCAILAVIFSYAYMSLIFLTFAILVENFYLGFTRGLMNMSKLAGFRLLENSLRFGILIVAYLLLSKLEFGISIFVYSFAGLISLVIFEVIRPEMGFRWHYDKKRLTDFLTYTAHIVMGAVSWTVIIALNPILIKHLLGNESVGFYSVAITLTQIFGFLPEAITMIALPQIASLVNKSKAKTPTMIGVLACIALSLILLAPLYFFRERIISLIFSQKYLMASSVILPLSIAQIFIAVSFIFATFWQGIGRPSVPTIIITIFCILNAAISYPMTQAYGIIGASYALAISSTLTFATLLVVTLRWKSLDESGNLIQQKP